MGPLPRLLGEGVPSLGPPHDVGGAPAAADDPSRIWLPELVQRFAGFLTGNEVACALRLVNKAAAAQFRRSQDRTVRLSLPVPHAEFVWRWGRADAMRSLTRQQRRELPSLTASSGCIANLEVLLARNDTINVWKSAVLNAAAAAGQLEACRWLRQQGCPLEPYGGTTYFAAGGGSQEVCEWLVANGSPVDPRAPGQAAACGHVGLMDWLLGTTKPSRHWLHSLLDGAAAGCDLPILQRLHHTYLDSVGEVLPNDQMGNVVASASASSTADWRAKVEWLEGRGFPRTVKACALATKLREQRDGFARLQWLRQRGYPLDVTLLEQAGRSGNLDMLRYLLAEGVEVDQTHWRWAAQGAAVEGHVAFLRALAHEHGLQAADLRGPTSGAALFGRLPVVEALVEMLGAADVLTVGVFRSAAHSGSMELLAWLHAHGCPWDQSVFSEAAEWGSEEAVEWLAAHGCPMGEDGGPYRRAMNGGDLGMLRCLRRLGCPWGPCGRTFAHALGLAGRHASAVAGRHRGSPTRAEEQGPTSLPATAGQLALLPWLLEQGCPVDWATALRKARMQTQGKELHAWLEGQRQQREQRA